MAHMRKPSLPKSIVALALLASLVVVYVFYDFASANPGGIYHFDESDSRHAWRQLDQVAEEGIGSESPPPPNSFSVCGRPAGAHSETWALQQKYATCPPFDPQTPTLVLQGYETLGRTGNLLRSFLHAVQYARDNRIQLGIMYNSWAMEVVLKLFMAKNNNYVPYVGPDKTWVAEVERSLCVKIIRRASEFDWSRSIHKSQEALFKVHSHAPYDEYVASQLHTHRMLFQNYNTGEGLDQHRRAVRDMCSGIDSLFAGGKEGEEDAQSSAKYSVIHLRYLEGNPGIKILGNVASRTGCDPRAALEMEPEYVKSILKPLGMMDYPIVIIFDGQNKAALDRLMSDPDIGPMVRVVPKEARWFGGDVTLAVMGNAFIGNPASTMSGFIARSRVALGFGNNYMYMAKDGETGEWKTICEDNCLFRYPKQSSTYNTTLPLKSATHVPMFKYHPKKIKYRPPPKSPVTVDQLYKAMKAAKKAREAISETAYSVVG